MGNAQCARVVAGVNEATGRGGRRDDIQGGQFYGKRRVTVWLDFVQRYDCGGETGGRGMGRGRSSQVDVGSVHQSGDHQDGDAGQ